MALKELSEYRKFNVQREMGKALATLKGILTGIACDDMISADETIELQNWLNAQDDFFNIEPLKSILRIISDALSDHILSQEEFEDILWACDKAMEETNEFDPFTIAIQVLHGIMHGALSDGSISDTEVSFLQNWIYDFDFLKGSYPYDELDSLITGILEDAKITVDEQNLLKVFFSDFIQITADSVIHPQEIAGLREKYCITGICATCPDIIFKEHTFCFTGISNRGTRSEIADKIEHLGGTYINRVSKKTDYLIIGCEGNPCFAYSCYGRKVEQAVQLRKSGCKIILIHENDFWDEVSE